MTFDPVDIHHPDSSTQTVTSSLFIIESSSSSSSSSSTSSSITHEYTHHHTNNNMVDQQTPSKTTTIVTTPSQDDLFDHHHHDDDEPMVWVSTLKMYATLFGWFIGVFIQCSSLGANQFLLMNNNNDNNNHDGAYDATTTSSSLWLFPWWSLLWSFATSAMGVTMLWILRKPILAANTNVVVSNNHRNSKLYDDEDDDASHTSTPLLLFHDSSCSSILEVCFSMGALAGVCMAWMITDVAVLGWSSQHLWHSAFTLATSILTSHILVRYWFQPNTTTVSNSNSMTNSSMLHDLEQPLLSKYQENNNNDNDDDGFIIMIPNTEHHTSTTTTSSSSSSSASLRPIALVLGGFVGIFIQFSSLGANFLSEQLQLDSDQVLVFSLIWSFWTSLMGIAILVIIRRILTLFLDIADAVLVQIECSFAVGATLGLNVAWTITDLAMGLETHMTQSFITLLGTLLWCRLVMYCYARNPNE